jgi:ubiquinone/menaquinone biosynthesis C-methylase UbiE
LRASAHEIPIDDEKLDVVVAIASLDHIPSVELALSEVRRVLRPGGIFLFILNNNHSWWKKLLSRTSFLERREAIILKDHYFLWSPSDAEKIVGKYLSKLSLSTTCFVPQIPKLWSLGFSILERLGSATHPLMGSNILGAFKKV